jgi:hypothetical protein
MSMKKFNYTIGNRTLDLPACSAVPQPTAPLRAPIYYTVWAVIVLSPQDVCLKAPSGMFRKRLIFSNVDVFCQTLFPKHGGPPKLESLTETFLMVFSFDSI